MAIKFYCDVCDFLCDPESLNIRCMYKVTLKPLDGKRRSHSFGGEVATFDLCEKCKNLAVENRVMKLAAQKAIDILKELNQGNKDE